MSESKLVVNTQLGLWGARPKSWWRTLLGYKSIFVITKAEHKGRGEMEIKEAHYEWMWRPNRKVKK